jgi:beta-phosphoglucomutase
MSARQKRKFRLVIFDMDGVITNTMPYHFDAWLSTMARAGIKVNCYDIYEREGQDGLTSVRELFGKYKVPFNLVEAKRILSDKEELFKRIVKKKFVKGSRPFIRLLKKRKFLLALVTGTSRHEVRHVLPEGIFDAFDAVITGSDVVRGKPYPEPFLRALQRLGVPAHDAAVIENAPFGIRSAKAAGLYCIALETSLPRRFLTEADAIFHSFDHIRQARIF